ncbi:asparagine synthetase B family protein [Dechloromonas denitrificans]|uniref:asparagine synthetase B family protein n=1 Tax=Dechloromonas denitrificans TaxID=281362 RepID=UPI001CF92BD7|nr:asparagine synthase C-terminal domain-containing protein [Dechloromonas denitrificans]UCV01938.1 asparagine synthase [Dechloromonas denitrificans]
MKPNNAHFTSEFPSAAFSSGRHQFKDKQLQQIAQERGGVAAWTEAFKRSGERAPLAVQGDFAVAILGSNGRAFIAVDRFSVCTLCYQIKNGQLHVAERADDLAGNDGELDPQALYDYLYFHMIPAPRTVFKGVYRLPAGHYALFENGQLTVAPWWKPHFVEDQRVPVGELKSEFRQILRDAVTDRLDGETTGCFLSGGTDSSTVAGLLREVTGQPARAFSIGFEAAGYDEMEYARIAARHFGAEHHEYYVTPDDLVRSIPEVAASYDQPFGNSSVVPSFYCAKAAREAGVTRILAGDGGDELFGGNTRYAKQRVFGTYEQIPGVLRHGLLEPLLTGTALPGRIPGIRKAVSYVEQASVPMPDRMQMYNLLTRLGLSEVLTPEFLALVNPQDTLRQQRDAYRSGDGQALVNRMLWYDWKYTLADNDLPKVLGATSLAGLEVGFPLLDDRLVDFSMRLDPELKLKGLTLRWFFKEALKDFLPPEIITKKKHGFGLPFGVWAVKHAGLRELALESVNSLRSRNIVRGDFIDRLIKEYLPQHPGYYGELVWVLMMLAQWLGQGRWLR